jgi:hypothetical protein
MHEVDAPDGATHYCGDLLCEPEFYKHYVNSTGTFNGWLYWNRKKNDSWYIHGETPPHFLKEIPIQTPP